MLLAEEDKVEDDVVFYLVFSGSTLRHCASTRKVSSDTLETITPGEYEWDLRQSLSSRALLFCVRLCGGWETRIGVIELRSHLHF